MIHLLHSDLSTYFFISADAFWLFFDYVLSKVINTSRVQMLKEKKQENGEV